MSSSWAPGSDLSAPSQLSRCLETVGLTRWRREKKDDEKKDPAAKCCHYDQYIYIFIYGVYMFLQLQLFGWNLWENWFRLYRVSQSYAYFS